MRDVLAYTLGLAIWLGIPAVCWLKGKRVLAVVGVMFLPIWIVIPAVRLAKDESWWARQFYDDGKLRRARERFWTPWTR